MVGTADIEREADVEMLRRSTRNRNAGTLVAAPALRRSKAEAVPDGADAQSRCQLDTLICLQNLRGRLPY